MVATLAQKLLNAVEELYRGTEMVINPSHIYRIPRGLVANFANSQLNPVYEIQTPPMPTPNQLKKCHREILELYQQYVDWVADEHALLYRHLPLFGRSMWSNNNPYAMPRFEGEGRISYYPDIEAALAGKRTTNPVNTAVRHITGTTNEAEISVLCDALGAYTGEYTLEFHTDGIEEVYQDMNDGLSSCMTYDADYFGEIDEYTHPTEVYNDSDLQLCVLKRKGSDSPAARTMVYPGRMLFTRIYGQAEIMARLLAARGYSYGTPYGAQLQMMSTDGSDLSDTTYKGTVAVICPYIDATDGTIDKETIESAVPNAQIFQTINEPHGACSVRIKTNEDGKLKLTISSRSQINGWELNKTVANQYENAYVSLTTKPAVTCPCCDTITSDYATIRMKQFDFIKKDVCYKCLPQPDACTTWGGYWMPLADMVRVRDDGGTRFIPEFEFDAEKYFEKHGEFYAKDTYVMYEGIVHHLNTVTYAPATGRFISRPLVRDNRVTNSIVATMGIHSAIAAQPSELPLLIEYLQSRCPEGVIEHINIDIETTTDAATDLPRLFNGEPHEETYRIQTIIPDSIQPAGLRGRSPEFAIFDDPITVEAAQLRLGDDHPSATSV